MKNKFILIVILAILAGGVAGYSIARFQKPAKPLPVVTSGSGANPEKLGEVMGKLNDLAE